MFHTFITHSHGNGGKMMIFIPSGGPCAGKDYRNMNSALVRPPTPHLELYIGLRTSNKLPLMMLTVVLPLSSAGNKSVFY